MNPQAEPFIRTIKAYERLESRRGKRNTEGTEPVSKHRIWPRRGESVGRGGPGRPNLARETNKSGENGNKGKGKRLYIEKITKQKKILARKKRRRGRTERRLAKKQAERSLGRTMRQVCIATHNVRPMAVDGKHSIGRA